jgi:two-component system sensor histidine kinase/response regulator
MIATDQVGTSKVAATGGEATECGWVPLDGSKILIVEDEPVCRRTLVGVINGAGWQALEVGTGEDALARYAELGPDLVLLDVVLPGMSGLEVCRRLRRQHGPDCVPIIFLTGSDAPADIVAGFEAGASDYVAKPWRDREVLARARAHLEARALMARQRTLVEKLTAANAAKDRFVSMVAHDLRSPLAGINGLLEFIEEGQLEAEQREMVGLVRQAGDSMLELVDELLYLARIESGRFQLETGQHRIGDLLRGRMQRMEPAASRKRIALNLVEVAPGRLVEIDREKLERVVDALLSNAVKFSPSDTRVTLQELPADGPPGFVVRDQGPGIPPAERGQLFRDFARLSTRPTGGEKSTGLGLSVARRIVEAHRGSISSENLPEGGCEFRVVLPLPP